MSTVGLKQFKLRRGSYENKGGERFEIGDTVETEIDLNEKFDPLKEMFERVPDFAPIGSPSDDGLDKLGEEGLRTLAEEEGIDLGKATKKETMVEKIRAALASV